MIQLIPISHIQQHQHVCQTKKQNTLRNRRNKKKKKGRNEPDALFLLSNKLQKKQKQNTLQLHPKYPCPIDKTYNEHIHARNRPQSKNKT